MNSIVVMMYTGLNTSLNVEVCYLDCLTYICHKMPWHIWHTKCHTTDPHLFIYFFIHKQNICLRQSYCHYSSFTQYITFIKILLKHNKDILDVYCYNLLNATYLLYCNSNPVLMWLNIHKMMYEKTVSMKRKMCGKIT